MIDVVSEDRVQMYINNHGGHIVNPDDATDCTLDEPEAQAGLQWLYDRMQTDGIMATVLDVGNVGTQAAFINGQVAMVEDGSWALKNILSQRAVPHRHRSLPRGPGRPRHAGHDRRLRHLGRHRAPGRGVGVDAVPAG